jgi:acetyl esterase/lipase
MKPDQMAKMSKRAGVVRAVTGAVFKLTDSQATDAYKTRRKLHTLANFLPTAMGVQVTPGRIVNFKVEWLTPRKAPQDKLILYMHGGAFIMGGFATHRPFVSHIARAAGIRTVIPQYRLAPEHPFPAAIEDGISIYRELIATGLMPEDIIFAGDSAGANLALAMLLTLRDSGQPLPAAACLLSPWIDLAVTGETMTTNAAVDPWFRAEDIKHIAKYYCDESEMTNPLVSPVYADVSGLPPLFIQVGGDEILLSDSTRLAENVRSCGGQVRIEVWPRMWHVFQLFVGAMPESRKAIDQIGDYIRHTFAQ